MVSKKGFNKSRMQILVTLMKLRQACCHLDLLKMDDLNPKLPSSKMELFFELLDEALDGADVVNVMRIQLERQRAAMFPSQREYTNLFGINKERLRNLNRNYTIMHPGPMNRGVEISSDVADSSQSVILAQVTNGVAVRMAVLYLLSGRKETA